MDGENKGAYVRKVRDETQKYIQDLLAENCRLQLISTSLEADQINLQEQITQLRQEVTRREDERARLQQQVAAVEEESRRFLEQYGEVEQQNSNLANLYVASYRLHSTLDSEEVLSAVQEIIINLIGSEEVAIFEMDDQGQSLKLRASFGLDEVAYSTIPVGLGLIGKSAQTGEMYVLGTQPEADAMSYEEELSACIPLRICGKTTGVIAIFRLLEQKVGLLAIDQELFDLLATHAAKALYCTKLHALHSRGL